MGGLGFLPRCENPSGCRKMAVFRVEAVRDVTGVVAESADLCAYCADETDVPSGYQMRQRPLSRIEGVSDQ